ncbi:hypothetical protein JCM12296A_39720 [Desulfosarcina cetonica]
MDQSFSTWKTLMGCRSTFDGFVKSPISALRVSLVTAEYAKYAAYGTRDSGILRIRKP